MTWSRPESVSLTLQFPAAVAVDLDPQHTVVVVVDMQNASLKTPNSDLMARLGVDNNLLKQSIQGVEALLAKAREAGVRVIFIQSVRPADSPEFTVFDRPRYLAEGSRDVEIIEELAPLPSEPVIQKFSQDSFAQTGLERYLLAEGINPGMSVVVCGVGLDSCVRAAVMGFVSRHYRVVLPMDCTGGSTFETEAMTYAQFSSALGGCAHKVLFSLVGLVSFGSN